MKIAKEPVSLETPVGDEEDSSLGDFIEDKNALQPLGYCNSIKFKRVNNKNFSFFNSKRRKSFKDAFWNGMNTDHTLEEVGLQFSVTRERIRQIEAKALRKLKHLVDQNN